MLNSAVLENQTPVRIQKTKNQPKENILQSVALAGLQNIQETMATSGSQVRVGVRVRPLTHQEAGQGGKSVLATQAPEIRLGERRFTYDSVFDASVSQRDLYREVSAPLQTSFLDGYNATVS